MKSLLQQLSANGGRSSASMSLYSLPSRCCSDSSSSKGEIYSMCFNISLNHGGPHKPLSMDSRMQSYRQIIEQIRLSKMQSSPFKESCIREQALQFWLDMPQIQLAFCAAAYTQNAHQGNMKFRACPRNVGVCSACCNFLEYERFCQTLSHFGLKLGTPAVHDAVCHPDLSWIMSNRNALYLPCDASVLLGPHDTLCMLHQNGNDAWHDAGRPPMERSDPRPGFQTASILHAPAVMKKLLGLLTLGRQVQSWLLQV